MSECVYVNIAHYRKMSERGEREREKGKKRHSVFVTGNSVARTRKGTVFFSIGASRRYLGERYGQLKTVYGQK